MMASSSTDHKTFQVFKYHLKRQQPLEKSWLLKSKDVEQLLRKNAQITGDPSELPRNRVEALEILRGLYADPRHHSQTFAFLPSLSLPLTSALLSKEYQVSRGASLTIAFISQQFEVKSVTFVEPLFRTLCGLIGFSNHKYISIVASEAVITICESVQFSDFLQILYRQLGECQWQRLTVYKALEVILQSWSRSILGQEEEILKRLMKNGLTDFNDGIKAQTRRCIYDFLQVFPGNEKFIRWYLGKHEEVRHTLDHFIRRRSRSRSKSRSRSRSISRSRSRSRSRSWSRSQSRSRSREAYERQRRGHQHHHNRRYRHHGRYDSNEKLGNQRRRSDDFNSRSYHKFGRRKWDGFKERNDMWKKTCNRSRPRPRARPPFNDYNDYRKGKGQARKCQLRSVKESYKRSLSPSPDKGNDVLLGCGIVVEEKDLKGFSDRLKWPVDYEPEIDKLVYVQNLSSSCNEKCIYYLLKPFGELLHLQFWPVPEKTQIHAVVEFQEISEVSKALQSENDLFHFDRFLKLSACKPKPKLPVNEEVNAANANANADVETALQPKLEMELVWIKEEPQDYCWY